VIAPVHFAGRPCEIRPIAELAKLHDLIIIEDACHAFGAEYRGDTKELFQKVGSCSLTSMAVFSFHPVKHVTTGEGGAVTTSDPKLAKHLAMLRSHGITKDASTYRNKARSQNGLNPWYHEMQHLGLNYRLCDIQAALGASQVKRASANIKRRREIARTYDIGLSGLKNLSTPAGDSETCKHSYHLYPVRIDYEALGITRASFMGQLKELGVGSQVHYIPVPWHPFYENNKNLWLADDIPEAVRFYEQELSLPMYHALTDLDQFFVINALKKLLG
jgi:dTDP-4-amino-4,6-dideoxygalactose transaminase